MQNDCLKNTFRLGMWVLAAWGLGAALPAWADDRGSNDQVFAADEVVRLGSPGKIQNIICNLSNADIRVVAEDRRDVAPVLVKHGTGASPERAREDARSINTSLETQGNSAKLKIENSGAGLDKQPSLVLHVPREEAVDLTDSNATVTCFGPLRNVKIKNENGKIIVKGAGGVLDLATSGEIMDIEAGHAQVNAVNSSGKIKFKGSLAPGKQVFTTTNEEIVLHLAPASRFELNAETSNGEITSDFPLDIVKQDNNTLHATLGDKPDTQLTLRTSNSNIKVNSLKAEHQGHGREGNGRDQDQ